MFSMLSQKIVKTKKKSTGNVKSPQSNKVAEY